MSLKGKSSLQVSSRKSGALACLTSKRMRCRRVRSTHGATALLTQHHGYPPTEFRRLCGSRLPRTAPPRAAATPENKAQRSTSRGPGRGRPDGVAGTKSLVSPPAGRRCKTCRSQPSRQVAAGGQLDDARRTVVFDGGPGRLGNDMFRYAAAFGIACATGARLMRRSDGLRVCNVFPAARGCDGESFDTLQRRERVRLSTIAPERVAWAPARWRPLPGRYNLLTGYRQSPVYWQGCAASLRAQLVFAHSVARAADALRGPVGEPGRPCISAYHRQGDEYSLIGNPYHNCLPGAEFYEEALPALASEAASEAGVGAPSPPRAVVLTSSYFFDAPRFLSRAAARANATVTAIAHSE